MVAVFDAWLGAFGWQGAVGVTGQHHLDDIYQSPIENALFPKNKKIHGTPTWQHKKNGIFGTA